MVAECVDSFGDIITVQNIAQKNEAIVMASFLWTTNTELAPGRR